MIVISGNTFDISTIEGEFPQNSIERQLLKTMSESSERYKFDSLNQLKFELALRREIVNAAKELNKSDFSFAVFRKSKSNPKYWDRTQEGGFRLKDGVSPSDAINDIFINGSQYATECATAMEIVYYKALLSVFPKEVFDRLFSDIYLMNWHSIAYPLREIGVPKDVNELLLGDRGYFANPDVDPKTPEWQGENVIVLPDEKYYGHGIGIATAPRIISSLNGNRKEGATRSAYLMDAAGRPDFKKLAEMYYRNVQPSSSQAEI